MSQPDPTFPQGFLWGSATAAYQVEGAVDADGRGPSIWDTFSATPGKVRGGDTGAVACDQYRRYPQDIALMADLGLRAYRFSIAWARIQPEGSGPANPKGLDHYRRLVEQLRERGIEPMVTLYHWDLPQALQDAGGWPARATAERFADYASLVGEALGDLVDYWTTLNEPWVSSHLGYGSGVHAPGVRDAAQCLAATHHLLLGHGLAAQALRAASHADLQVGITLNLTVATPASDAEEDAAAAHRLDGDINRLFLDPVLRGRYPGDMVDWFGGEAAFPFLFDGDLATIAGPLDFLGVNYYFRSHVRASAAGEPAGPRATVPSIAAVTEPPPELPRTAMGWPVEPDGLRELLVRLHDDYPGLPPVYITENGAAYDDRPAADGTVDDLDRVAYLDGHVRALAEAVAAGVDVRGYFVWSLLDNFEWAEGYAKRFGIVFVDYATQRRIPKASARWYARVVRDNHLPPPDENREV
jgi:beta-glucosidase